MKTSRQSDTTTLLFSKMLKTKNLNQFRKQTITDLSVLYRITKAQILIIDKMT